MMLPTYYKCKECECDFPHKDYDHEAGLCKNCLIAKRDAVAKLQLQRGVITTDCARQINEYLKGLSSYDERLQLLEIMSNDICIHCGDVNKGRCHCTNDE